MRIIAGTHRGRPILPPPGRNTRPITDRAKESLFSIIGPQIEGARVADIFAGTGSLGLEALSRGAASALFCEKDRAALRLLRQNIVTLGLSDGASISSRNAWQLVRWCRTAEALDLIFLDPPYSDSREVSPTGQVGSLLTDLGKSELLSADGLIILRHEAAYPRQAEYPPFILSEARSYGIMTLSFLAWPVSPTGQLCADQNI